MQCRGDFMRGCIVKCSVPALGSPATTSAPWLNGSVNMPEVDFDQYSQDSIHFFDKRVPELLARAVAAVGESGAVVDVGCGDGHMVWSLLETGRITRRHGVVGIDISPIRLKRFEALTGFRSMLAVGHRLPISDDGSVELAMSTMVVEHVPDDAAHVRELARIVRPEGRVYLSTVLRKKGAWYFRKAPDGRRVLDPTHLREYPSEAAVLELFDRAGLRVLERSVSRLFFPVAHPILRWFHAHWPIRDPQRFFLRPATAWLEWLALPIPRYRAIEIIACRQPASMSIPPHGASA